MRLRVAVTITVAFLVLGACVPKSPPAARPMPELDQPAADASEGDASVYATVIDSLFDRNVYTSQRVLVLVETTELSGRDHFIASFWSDLYRAAGSDSSMVDDLERRGRTRLSLRSIGPTVALHINWPLQLVTTATLAGLPRTGPKRANFMGPSDYFWDAFYKMFPGALGTVSMSAVGYSRSGDRAILFVSHGCHSLCGEGHIVTLRRVAGQWRVVGLRQTWVS